MLGMLNRYLISNLNIKYLIHESVKQKDKIYLVRKPFLPYCETKKYFCSKIPKEENAQKEEDVENKGKKIETTQDQYPHITDDEGFEKKFWQEYERKMAKEREMQDSQPYLDRIRYRKVYKNPIERTVGILRDDILEFFGQLKHNSVVSLRDPNHGPKPTFRKDEIFPNYCDVVIIGGGLVGTSIAFHLQEKALQGLRIVVVEKDMSYSRASSVLSVGGIRQQFSTPENIVLSKYGMDFLQLAKQRLHVEGEDIPDIPINFNGYLTLASEEGAPQLLENYKIQRDHNAYVQLLTKEKLKANFPWINIEGIEAGVYGVQREGWIDPWSLLLAMSRKTRQLGTCYINGTVIESERKPLGDTIVAETTPSTMYKVMKVEVKLPNGETRDVNCALCVIAAGCSSGEVGRLFGIGTAQRGNLSCPIPVEPRKRYVYSVHSPNGPSLNCPLAIDPSGAYFRREGLADMYLCGRCPQSNEEPPVDDLSVDDNFFEESVWPFIAHRCPSFENLKMRSSWAGFYDYNTFDQNALIGRHPMFSNLFMATGFSGHGIQQAAGAGQAISELVLDAEYSTLNIERLGFERLLLDEPIVEKCVY